MADRQPSGKHYHEIVSESMREIGILLLVFVPLDTIWHLDELKKMDRTACLKLAILTAFGVLGFILTISGIQVERGD